MPRLLLHIVLVVLALAPGGFGTYLITRGPTDDTSRSALVLMGIPLVVLSAALLLFAAWSLLRDR